MSAEDAWQLKIPVRLALAQDEISSPGDVKPVYVLAPRFAYLPALAQQCLNFFQHVLLSLPGQPNTSNPWFEFEGLALNWTQPLGVLHDLLTQQLTGLPAQGLQEGSQQDAAGFSTTAVPWCLTVHYRNQPASLASSWQNSGTAKDHFFSSLKEAGYCCRGTDGCNAVMRLPGPVQDDVWVAVNRGDAAAVRQHMTPLRLSPSPRQGSSIPTVPVRLYVRQHKAGDAAGLVGVWSEVYSTSRALEAQQPDGSSTLLAHLVHAVLPQHFPAPQQAATAATAAAAAARASSSDSMQQQGPQQVGPAQQKLPPEGPRQEAQQGAPAGPPAAPDPLGGEGESQATQPQEAQHAESAEDPLGVLSSTSRPAAGAEQQGSGGSSAAAACDSALAGQASDSADAAAGASQGPGQQHSSGGSSTQQELQQPPGSAVNTAACAVAADGGVVLPAHWPQQCAVYVCGIKPDWCTPLGWLHANLKAADGFLYVVVHLAV